MKLNHLNLLVDDVQAANDFFVDALDFSLVKSGGDAMSVLSDSAGFTLIVADPKRFGGDSPVYPEGFHVGFIVESRDRVDEFHARLLERGLPLEQVPERRHGNYGFYFTALNGLLFEVSA